MDVDGEEACCVFRRCLVLRGFLGVRSTYLRVNRCSDQAGVLYRLWFGSGGRLVVYITERTCERRKGIERRSEEVEYYTLEAEEWIHPERSDMMTLF